MNPQETLDPVSEGLAPGAWLIATVAVITRRPCVVELVAATPARSGGFGFFGDTDAEPAHWRITIKGIDCEPCISLQRIQLRDDEYVKRRVMAVLPKDES